MISATISGVKETTQALGMLAHNVQRNVVRRAIREECKAAASQIAGTEKNQHMRDAASHVVRTYRGGSAIVGVVGYSLPKFTEGTNEDGRPYPTNLDWLLEYGHRIVVGGTTERLDGKKAQRSRQGEASTGEGIVVGFVQGTGVVRKVYDTVAQPATRRLTHSIARGVEREAKKLSWKAWMAAKQAAYASKPGHKPR